MEGLAQANTVPNSSNSSVMAQSEQLAAAMAEMQKQLKTLSSPEMKIKKRKYYCCICERNSPHEIKACPTNKDEHKYEVYYYKGL